MKCESETKQTAPPFSKRVDDQRAHEQPHRDPDGDLDHAVCDVKDITVDVDGGSAGRVTDRGRPIGRGAVDRLVRELVRGRQPADQTASCGEARRHLHEDGWQERGCREPVAQAAVEVSDDADGEGAEGVCYLGVG